MAMAMRVLFMTAVAASIAELQPKTGGQHCHVRPKSFFLVRIRTPEHGQLLDWIFAMEHFRGASNNPMFSKCCFTYSLYKFLVGKCH